MKNLKYFPYERNRYFYGKLLGVDDFEAEQKYMNDKRRLINRFMHGCGVVCGLNVVQIGDDAISVEPGMALDFAGREIVLDEPVTRKLSELEGFSDYAASMEAGGYLYLCIEYEEYEKNPVYSVADSGAGEDVQCNRIAEGYHIYVTEQEPEQGNSGSCAYYEAWKTLYWGNGIRISQVFPRYAKSGSEFEARIVVENMGQKQPVSFHYELVFDCMKKDGKQYFRAAFDENDHERAKRYEIPFTLEAGNGKGLCGWAALKEGSFALKIGGHEVDAQVSVENTVEITDEPVGEVIRRRYFAQAMRQVQNETYHQSLYLAKISLFGVGNTVVIDDVEEMPFGQYICSDVLSGIRELAAGQEQRALERRIASGAAAQGTEKAAEPRRDAAFSISGTAVIELGIGGLKGQKFFSAPVTHGFGPGNVSVVCGIAGSAAKSSAVYYGAPEVFADAEREVSARTAVKVDTVGGTFVIGIVLTEPTAAEQIKVHWTAFCDCGEAYGEQEERALFLKPDMVYLALREDYYFEPVLRGTDDRDFIWSVTEKEGGSIDENGMYTAPSVPGIYEIVVKSAAYPKLSAVAYAVVRDIKKG
ncbi:MAG: hypothetical protein NC409_04375 [Clostridium sp.]|nr:hypothetical protein [Clostridium sp.]